MWYETIPAMAMIVGALTLSGIGVGAVQRFFNGGKVTTTIATHSHILLLVYSIINNTTVLGSLVVQIE
jgi:hypothetical protein